MSPAKCSAQNELLYLAPWLTCLVCKVGPYRTESGIQAQEYIWTSRGDGGGKVRVRRASHGRAGTYSRVEWVCGIMCGWL